MKQKQTESDQQHVQRQALEKDSAPEAGKQAISPEAQFDAHPNTYLWQAQRTIGNRYTQKLIQNSPPIQARFKGDSQNDMSESQVTSFAPQPIQKKENRTGLPDNLKSGIENLSGYSLDDVSVHYNSNKPSQLQAHAYAQGTDIHLASGQEKYLPHEAWHVVQQLQERVKPTIQIQNHLINDNKALENEATLMGKKAIAIQETFSSPSEQPNVLSVPMANPVIQRALGFEFEASKWISEKNGKKLAKKTLIDSGTGWTLRADSIGEKSDIEYETDPFTNIKALKKAILEMVDHADKIRNDIAQSGVAERPGPGNYEIYNNELGLRNAGEKEMEAHVQATIGVPLDLMYNFFDAMKSKLDHFSSSATLDRMNKQLSEGITPDKQALHFQTDELKGFLLLLIEYQRKGYVRKKEFGRSARGSWEKNLPKDVFPIMSRTHFPEIFAQLPYEDQIRFVGKEKENPIVQKEWIKWIEDMGLGDLDDLKTDVGKLLIMYKLGYASLAGQDIVRAHSKMTREDWLRHLPTEDKLIEEAGGLGLGAFGSKTDVGIGSMTGKRGIILELRDLRLAGNTDVWLKLVEPIISIFRVLNLDLFEPDKQKINRASMSGIYGEMPE